MCAHSHTFTPLNYHFLTVSHPHILALSLPHTLTTIIITRTYHHNCTPSQNTHTPLTHSQGPTNYLRELLQDIVMELSQVTASKLTADVFSTSNVAHKLSRDYFIFLGTVSFNNPSLLRQCRAYGP